MKKVILYIAISLDGFIARKDGSVDWLDKFNNAGEEYGYAKFYESINTVMVGNTTFEQFPEEHKGKNCYVFSRSKNGKNGNAIYVDSEPEEFLKSLKEEDNENIWLMGGANLANQFLKSNLIDEFIITIIPICLGSGIRLFDDTNDELSLIMKDVKSYKSGLVQVHYEVKR